MLFSFNLIQPCRNLLVNSELRLIPLFGLLLVNDEELRDPFEAQCCIPLLSLYLLEKDLYYNKSIYLIYNNKFLLLTQPVNYYKNILV